MGYFGDPADDIGCRLAVPSNAVLAFVANKNYSNGNVYLTIRDSH